MLTAIKPYGRLGLKMKTLACAGMAGAALFLSSCTGSRNTHDPKQTGEIGRMLLAQKAYLQEHRQTLDVMRTVSIGHVPVQHADSVGPALNVLSVIQEIDPDRITGNRGSYNRQERQEEGGKVQVTEYDRKPGETIPFKTIRLSRTQDAGGNYTVWKGFLLERAEDNTLFHSEELYTLDFTQGKLTALHTYNTEKSKASDSTILQTDILLKERSR